MWHPSKGVIHLEDDSSGNEIVDSDMDEVVQWDRSLSIKKTFKTAVLSCIACWLMILRIRAGDGALWRLWCDGGCHGSSCRLDDLSA